MIEIGTVKKRMKQGVILVDFPHLGTEASCDVLQPTTGSNTTFRLPSEGTQVVCWLESGKNIALGAVFSTSEPVPSDATPDGLHVQHGGFVFNISEDHAAMKNDRSSLQSLFKELLKTLQNLTVSTPMGPSGTPLPPTIQGVQRCTTLLNDLLK